MCAQTLSDFECFIVDNGSTDESIARLPELDHRFTIMEMGENLGFAAANNRAAERSTAPWLALLNPDAFARPDWLAQLLAATELLPRVAMVGSTQHMALEPGVLDGLGDEYHAFGVAWRAGFKHPTEGTEIVTRKAFGPCGAGAFYRRDVYTELGGYDEAFFCYHEDVDLAYRMRLAGWQCVQSAEAIIDHVSSGVSGRASPFAVYHGNRNRIWTFFKNTPLPLMIFLFLPHLATSFALLFWSSVRAARFKPTFRGMRDGYFTRPNSKTPRVARQVALRDLLRSFGWNPMNVIRRSPVRTAQLQPLMPTLKTYDASDI